MLNLKDENRHKNIKVVEEGKVSLNVNLKRALGCKIRSPLLTIGSSKTYHLPIPAKNKKLHFITFLQVNQI